MEACQLEQNAVIKQGALMQMRRTVVAGWLGQGGREGVSRSLRRHCRAHEELRQGQDRKEAVAGSTRPWEAVRGGRTWPE